MFYRRLTTARDWLLIDNGRLTRLALAPVKILVCLVLLAIMSVSLSSTTLAATPQSQFYIWTTTGWRDDAGTDADVYIRVYGDLGSTAPFELDNRDRNDFERGATDRFVTTNWPSFNSISKIEIWHNNEGNKPGWFLETVQVYNMSTGRGWFFNCYCWLQRSPGYSTFVTLYPAR